MTFYINAVSMPDAYIEQRTSKDSWNAKTIGATRIPFVERASQDPTSISVELKFLGSERYNVATSIAAEIDQCTDIMLWNDSSKKLYGTDTHIWLSQSDFSIVEEEGHRLICDLSGNINPYIVNSCDMTQWWSGTGGVTIATDDPHDGKQSIKLSKTSPVAYETYTGIYSLPIAMDMSDKSYINCWLKSNKTSAYFYGIMLRIGNDASNYYEWYSNISNEDTWYFHEFDLSTPDATQGSPDLTAIDIVGGVVHVDTGTDDWDVYIDEIKIR